jgi:hypothetical protein
MTMARVPSSWAIWSERVPRLGANFGVASREDGRMAEQGGFRLGTVLASVSVAILTAGSAPWWWPHSHVGPSPAPSGGASASITATTAAQPATPPLPEPPGAVYAARLSDIDHCNSNGQRLSNAGLIIRQDRANFHRRWHMDPDDGGDDRFSDEVAREQLVSQLTIDPPTARRIVATTPRVAISAGPGGYNVAIVADGPAVGPCPL